MCTEAGAGDPEGVGGSFECLPKGLVCCCALTLALGVISIFSLSDPNELCEGPVLDDIPSHDAANTVANYS